MKCKEKSCKNNNKLFRKIETLAEEFNETVFHYKNFNQFLRDLELDTSQKLQSETYFDTLEHNIIEEEKKIHDLVDSYKNIKNNLENSIEKKCIYDKSFQLINSSEELKSLREEVNMNHLEEGHDGFKFFAGLINSEDEIKMKRMIFRMSKGTCVPSFFESTTKLNDRESKDKNKKIFTILIHCSSNNYFLNKFLNICDLFGASKFLISGSTVSDILRDLHIEISEKKEFLRESEISIKNYLRMIMGNVNHILIL
jgi:V-type H+-transporting ATPase subunit a